MTVKRITANLNTRSVSEMRSFYNALFGLDVLMDHGWMATLGTRSDAPVQLSIATEGGEGTPVPEISIEVDDLDEVLAKARALEHDILYGPETESWGVRRFMLHDPSDNLINVLMHI
ncbi:VOC family protein [Lentibacter sp. XHP0401]|uniref:VOC family protein n=1 Tax=Lentibacter sp. XHP0401 TaxID=2984334 RepID=UPI0021E910D0|nr:VOC family protein [Lentibacter sp. XHP0401]MCV2893210.1 glyoxalase [Lentibacter sp. XHP0401]